MGFPRSMLSCLLFRENGLICVFLNKSLHLKTLKINKKINKKNIEPRFNTSLVYHHHRNSLLHPILGFETTRMTR